MARLSAMMAVLLAVLAFAHGARAFTLTVKGNGGCTGFQYTIKKEEYNYTQRLGEVTLGEGCTNADLSISKLYIPGACANSRLNNFGFSSLNPTQINCDTVENYSEETCNKVFDQAPAKAIVKNLTTDEFIDTDNICWPADVGFVFVKNECNSTSPDARVAVDVKINSYSGPGCDVVRIPGFGKGVGLSPGAIVGIVIAVVVIVLIIAVLIYCCCCQLRR
jgi:hypothetical protein